MKLLIITQGIDTQDPVLGFFHRWIEGLAKKFERIEVICLFEGEHNLPANVRVHSLGKEGGRKSRMAYAGRFLSLVWNLRPEYDTVFVHMNQEYILIAGWLWKLLGKPVYFWRNHTNGSFLTDIAVSFSKRVFCTAKHSYTMRFKKTERMPVGIDTDIFAPNPTISRVPGSILSLGRISPVKSLEVLIEAVPILRERAVPFTMAMYGNSDNVPYEEMLKKSVQEKDLQSIVPFYPGVPNTETANIYSAYDIFVNLTQTGSFDKSIFEALSCGCLVVTSNESLRGHIDDRFLFKEGDARSLAGVLEQVLALPEQEKEAYRTKMRQYIIEQHSLSLLLDKLTSEFIASSRS